MLLLQALGHGWSKPPGYCDRVSIRIDPLAVAALKPWDELLNQDFFLNLSEVGYMLDEWQLDYNCRRSRSSLNRQAKSNIGIIIKVRPV